ncbi:MAG: hypothetical protein ACI9MC_003513 [Kiritimatiellia bacterium]|jgi:hypothetical protein
MTSTVRDAEAPLDLVRDHVNDRPVQAEPVWVAIADLHGHPDHLDALLERLDAAHAEHLSVVLLGDYVDNGPDIPRLLDRLIALRDERPGRFVPILGNHDLACLRALGFPGQRADPTWYRRWSTRYSDPGGGTATAYGAHDADSFKALMPTRHQAFLRSLPWCLYAAGAVFVHAGLRPGPQLPQLRDKTLAGVSDPDWDRVVVSAHTKNPAARTGITDHRPHIVTDRRICLSGEIDRTGNLYAIELPTRRIWRVDPSLRVTGS